MKLNRDSKGRFVSPSLLGAKLFIVRNDGSNGEEVIVLEVAENETILRAVRHSIGNLWNQGYKMTLKLGGEKHDYVIGRVERSKNILRNYKEEIEKELKLSGSPYSYYGQARETVRRLEELIGQSAQ